MDDLNNCIVYARFSSKGQRHGTSIVRQLGDGRDYANRKGWGVIGELIDEGRSAFHGHHRTSGLLGKFEAEARHGDHRGTVLVVERLDRLERGGPEDTFSFITGLTSAGVTIATIDGDELYRAGAKLDMVQMMLLLLKAQLAHEESAKKSERSRANWRIKHQRAAETGRPLSKRCPAWLRVRGNGYEVIPGKAALIARIFSMADAGEGTTSITRTLNTEAAQRLGPATMWHRARVVGLLSNAQVIGDHSSPSGTFKLYPPIVGAEVFERVSNLAMIRKIARGRHKNVRVLNLLAGLCSCLECKGSMSYLGGGYMQCMRASQWAGCSNSSMVAYPPLERAVLDSCLHLALDDSVFSNQIEVARLDVTIAECESEVQSATSNAAQLLKLKTTDCTLTANAVRHAAERRVTSLHKTIHSLRAQRDRARGGASVTEHISRVSDIRGRLVHDVTLRGSVNRGFRRVVDRVWFARDKSVTLQLANDAKDQIRIVNGVVVEQPHQGQR